MRSLKVLAVCAIALLVTGCSCRTNTGEGNIGGGDGGPLKDIHFSFDSYKIDATSKSIVAANAEWLKANPGKTVQVEGHCDERGPAEYNMVLGSNRARAAAAGFLRPSSTGWPADRCWALNAARRWQR